MDSPVEVEHTSNIDSMNSQTLCLYFIIASVDIEPCDPVLINFLSESDMVISSI